MNPTTIMTASHAVAGGAMNTTTPSTLELKIKRWVELDNKIKSTAEQVRDIRTEKSVINDEILEIIEEKQLGKATVNISDGKLKFVNSKSTAPLTLTYIEKCLSELITNGDKLNKSCRILKRIERRRRRWRLSGYIIKKRALKLTVMKAAKTTIDDSRDTICFHSISVINMKS